MQAGDVIWHEAFEAHLNRYNSLVADLIVLPAPVIAEFPNAVGAVRDADAIVRLAEKDAREAVAQVVETMVSARRNIQDWPHALAEALREDLHLGLDAWASEHRLADATVSRAFRRERNASSVFDKIKDRCVVEHYGC